MFLRVKTLLKITAKWTLNFFSKTLFKLKIFFKKYYQKWNQNLKTKSQIYPLFNYIFPTHPIGPRHYK